ncbi:MAG: hypothetical protein PHY23_00315 [Oscillospiraceae bacterium]|nr:hypothetical protein [Oscillospiraceae bacterium]
MIINRPGETFEYNDVLYTIGALIVGTDESEYAGLYGSITEIRDGEDQDTENITPDIYCVFDAPALPQEIVELEKTFSDLYDETKQLCDISLDEVIMAPDMIRLLNEPVKESESLVIYMLIEDWASNGEPQHSCELFADYDSAKRRFNEKLLDEMENGAIPSWAKDSSYVVETGKDSYIGYVDGEYCEDHYSIEIRQQSLHMPTSLLRRMGDIYIAQCHIEDFISQIENWDELDELTEGQYEKMLHDPTLSEMIDAQLGKNDPYWEAYWESVSEVAFEMIRKYTESNDEKLLAPDMPEPQAEGVESSCQEK